MAATRRGAIGCAAALALLGWGCDASSGGGGLEPAAAAPHCGQFSPCGGSIVGTWVTVDACIIGSTVVDLPQCSGLQAETTDYSPEWTTIFHPDGTWEAWGVVTQGVRITGPLTCFGGPAACVDYGATLRHQDPEARCAAGATQCDCTYSPSTGAGTRGTYTVAGDVVTTQGQGQSETTTMEVCAQGEFLQTQTVNPQNDSLIVAVMHADPSAGAERECGDTLASGSAVGSDLSGEYRYVESSLESCECTAGDLCDPQQQITIGAPIHFEQQDGLLTADHLGFEIPGRVDADGTFALSAWTPVVTLSSGGEVGGGCLTWDGAFERDASGRVSRVTVTTRDEWRNYDGSVDCRRTIKSVLVPVDL